MREVYGCRSWPREDENGTFFFRSVYRRYGGYLRRRAIICAERLHHERRLDAVSVIDTATNTVTGLPIAVGILPRGVAVTPDGSEVYVTNTGSNTMSVIDTATNTVVGTRATSRPFRFVVPTGC
jgi:YVTN family beta-propeller protein